MRATDVKDVTVRVPGSCGELLQAEHGDTGRPRHDEMRRCDRDIRWQV